jgi:hypothetical protein
MEPLQVFLKTEEVEEEEEKEYVLMQHCAQFLPEEISCKDKESLEKKGRYDLPYFL